MANLKDYGRAIREDAAYLEGLVKSTKGAQMLRRVQLLYLLKSGLARTAGAAASAVGLSPTYARKLVRDYEKDGLDALLTERPAPKTPPAYAKQEDLDALKKAINAGKVRSSPQARDYLNVERKLPYRSDSAVYHLLRSNQMLPASWRRRRNR